MTWPARLACTLVNLQYAKVNLLCALVVWFRDKLGKARAQLGIYNESAQNIYDLSSENTEFET